MHFLLMMLFILFQLILKNNFAWANQLTKLQNKVKDIFERRRAKIAIYHKTLLLINQSYNDQVSKSRKSESQMQKLGQDIIIIIQPKMKGAIFLALICTFSMQQVPLFSSNIDNTIITSPANYYPVLEAYHTQIHANYIGYNAQWLYKNGSDSWPVGDNATFTAYFYAACQSSVTLVIAADDAFSASMNGGKPAVGDTQLKIYRYAFSNLKCGVNTFTITATNNDAGAPTGVIFAVVQDQTSCFTCDTALAYFNRQTCSCQCVDKSTCPTVHRNYVWKNYPVCGCKCSSVLKCSALYYFNGNSCACECTPIACLANYVQSQKSCRCIKKCPIITTCAKNMTWDQNACKCVCTKITKCSIPFYWNTVTCGCENPTKVAGTP